MLVLTLMGKPFGMSSNLRSLCAMTGVGKHFSFFDWDWKSQRWNLAVVFGAMLGGLFARYALSDPTDVTVSADAQQLFQSWGLQQPNGQLLPAELFDPTVATPYTILLLFMGGLLVGFGSRYAGGCTSGHAISGLSNFQLPSLKAVIGFFIGGLLMSYVILPYVLAQLS